MKFSYVIFLIFFVLSCAKTKLFPVTAEILLEKISSYRGKKAVLINIWALWCEPCVEEFPMILKLKNENKDLEVIFVSADFEDDIEEVVNFLTKHDIGPMSYLKKQKDENFIHGLSMDWNGGLPFTMIFSKQSGENIDFWEGKKPVERFQRAIIQALN